MGKDREGGVSYQFITFSQQADINEREEMEAAQIQGAVIWERVEDDDDVRKWKKDRQKRQSRLQPSMLQPYAGIAQVTTSSLHSFITNYTHSSVHYIYTPRSEGSVMEGGRRHKGMIFLCRTDDCRIAKGRRRGGKREAEKQCTDRSYVFGRYILYIHTFIIIHTYSSPVAKEEKGREGK